MASKSDLQSLAGLPVLVTGADGFIGSHLAETLVRSGASVRAFAFYNSFGSWGWLEDLPADIQASIEVLSGDIRDPHAVVKAAQGCSTVFHLAALISIPFSYNSPAAYIETNISGTLNVLQAARDAGASRVVCTSTSEVYGSARYVPIDEAHPLQAQSPYAASKIGADQLALSFHKSFGLPVVLLRPFNTFGPRQSARAVIPTIITQIASGAEKIRLGSLHPTRDFSYVSDTVNGFLHAATAQAAVGQTINVGSGFEISIGDTAELIAELMGASVEIEHADERTRPPKSEVERLWAANAKALACMGWSPQYGGRDGFARALRKTIDWFQVPSSMLRYRPNRYSI